MYPITIGLGIALGLVILVFLIKLCRDWALQREIEDLGPEILTNLYNPAAHNRIQQKLDELRRKQSRFF